MAKNRHEVLEEDTDNAAVPPARPGYLFLQVDSDLTQEKERMAQPRPRSSRSGDNHNHNSNLWFSMPSGSRHAEEERRGRERSVYQVTSARHSAHNSASPSGYPMVPLISTTTAINNNKPLPPSPEAERKKKPASLRSLIRRRPSEQIDPAHLQPESYQQQRPPSSNRSLTPDPYQHQYQHQSSRSMPASPALYPNPYSQTAALTRANSAAPHYTESNHFQSGRPSPQSYHQPSAISTNYDFEPEPPRARRTFPEAQGSTARDSMSDRPRPHTWLSPTEPVVDASQFHLFAAATSGLPGDFDPFSPNSPPQLQGSLFARGSQNDRIPLPLQNPSAASQPPQSQSVSEWQNTGYDSVPQVPGRPPVVSSSALPQPDLYQQSQLSPHMNAINLELERLGLEEDEAPPEDELPNYAQSQAEMSARRRQEATNRAKELEARWNNSRGGWGR
ncbi:hypothetical protein BDV95DRAFT_600874 [Massariosphaeria phaeospora]|uniref:Uncharacterized protein n=1 Tax=Massariosphaeria phaeospora TaxID=100035 RepID=A0A7C8MVT5_9PLEO|nr:hypothetical protein BDV95DRAFT_600874 [Massariosphaeria phaeospora]